MHVPQRGPTVSTEPVFWFYVKEVLSKHELQRFYALRHIASDVGRGRAWLRCALNEHSLERYLHMLLADHSRLRYLRGARGGSAPGGDHHTICPPASGAAGFPSSSPSLSSCAVGTVDQRLNEDACKGLPPHDSCMQQALNRCLLLLRPGVWRELLS